MMRIIKLEVGKVAYIKDIDDTDKLSAMQAEVGGLIEPIYPEDGIVILVNEEGLMNGSKPNRTIKDSNGNIIAVAGGDCFICGDTGEDFVSIPDDKIEKYMALYQYPQLFFRDGQNVIAQHYNPVREVLVDEPELF